MKNSDIETIDSLYKTDYYFKSKKSHVYKYVKNNVFEYNYQLNLLKSFNQDDTVKYRFGDLEINKVKEVLIGNDPKFYKLTDQYLEYAPGFSSYLVPSLNTFDISKNLDIYLGLAENPQML